SSESPIPVDLYFASAATGVTASVLTQGATGLDFTDAGTGTCTTNGTGHNYDEGSTCSVDVIFAPKYAGARYGAVNLRNSSGAVVATASIYGTGSGPLLVFPSNPSIQTLGSGGVSIPQSIAVDGIGNAYVVDHGIGSVKEIPLGCSSFSCVKTLGGGFNNPAAVALDGAGNIYVADAGNDAVYEMPPGCISSSCVTTLGGTAWSADGNEPQGIAVDGSGNIYVVDGLEGSPGGLKEIPPGCATSDCVATLGGALDGPVGVAVDVSGNVYVTNVLGQYDDGHPNTVQEISPGCTSSACVTTVGGGFNQPNSVALDGSGNIYVTDYLNNAVYEMPPGCASSSCVTTLGSGFKNPWGVAVDGSGNVYVSDYLNFVVKELPLATPPSLSFADTNVGSQSSDSPKPVTLRNIGNAPLNFPVPGTGKNPSISANFTLDASTTCPEVLSSGSAGTLSAGISCNLNVAFLPTTGGLISGSVVLTDNTLNASPAATQSIGLSGNGTAASTPLTPYIQLNGGAWQQISSAAVNVGDRVNLAPLNISGGSWNWSGPNGFTSTSREVDAVSLPSVSNLFTVTYTNTSGGTSSQAFTVTVNPTPLTPYIEANGGAWQQTSTKSVNVGDRVNLAPSNITGGGWIWSGPNGFTASTREIDGVPIPSASNVYTVTYTNTSGSTSSQAFTVTVSPTPLTPYIEVNGGAWQQVSSVAVNVGDRVNLAPLNITGGSWSWSGPNGFTASTREIDGIPISLASNVYTVSYTNTSGVTGSQTFTVTVNPTPLTPYIEVNGGAWQQVSSVAVNVGDTVNLAPLNINGGSWSWTGPGGFTSTARQINRVSLTSASNVYTVTYTNTSGATSSQAFTVTVNPTAVVPYLEVNRGAWQQASSTAANVGDKVNLAGQNISGGTWIWTGPNGFTSTSREIDAVPLTTATNTYTLTYTNTDGVASSPQTFLITINPTPIVPYIRVNGGAWQQAAGATVLTTDTVNLAGLQQTGGTWSWTGPNSFSSTSREIDAVPLMSGTNTYTATYTNIDGVNSTQGFTITANPPPTLVSIEVSPSAPNLWSGTTEKFMAIGNFSDGSSHILPSPAWSSGTPGVATVATDGTSYSTATAVTTGTSTISATVGAVSSSAALTVLPPPVTQQGVDGVPVDNGTTGNDTLFLQGTVQQLNTTLTNDYSGESVAINDTYNLNTSAYNGMSGTDTLLMSNVNDAIFALTGSNMTLNSVENIAAGPGNDIVDLASNQVLLGNLTITGSNGDDLLWGNAGNDVIQGNDGNDRINGGPGNDNISGGNGDDIVDGGAGNDTVTGDAGNDTLIYTWSENVGATDVYDGGLDTDTLVLRLTQAQANAAAADIAAAQAFIAAHSDPTSGTGPSFTFSTFGLTFSNIEALSVVITGP
ncbi:MAG TPA: Ig-like domain-containing protein, partial [Acidobacteriaceae bacterium]|nr:Ig-like domain-containing protein [Acidobacteriaceae bacterium]